MCIPDSDEQTKIKAKLRRKGLLSMKDSDIHEEYANQVPFDRIARNWNKEIDEIAEIVARVFRLIHKHK